MSRVAPRSAETAWCALELLGQADVDLAAVLDHLGGRRGITAIRVDAGSSLNGALLRAGLVDEVRLLVCPAIAAGPAPSRLPLFDEGPSEARTVKLKAIERLRDDHLLLTYQL